MTRTDGIPQTAKGYSPSPRPTYDVPTLVTRRDVRRHIWGDLETGYVADWIYASGSKLHTIVFGLAAGRSFKHSPSYRTIFGADEVLYVASGTMSLANPGIQIESTQRSPLRVLVERTGVSPRPSRIRAGLLAIRRALGGVVQR